MKVLALTSYPIEAAATRYRLAQFVAPLAERGITLSVHPFIDSQQFASLYERAAWPQTARGLIVSAFQRFRDVWRSRSADVLLVQREAMMFGPPLIEWLAMNVGRCPMVLDLDDATYVSYISPTYNRFGSWLKWFGKTDKLIAWAQVVICGNNSIADYVSGKGAYAIVVPTVADTERFRPRAVNDQRRVPVLGWIGTHSTYPYLESIFPALQRLARTHPFRLKVVGAGKSTIILPGVEVENLPWSLAREVDDLQSFDIGLYPLIADEWSSGKSGFKAIQYMAVGIPYVATPVGAAAEIGVAWTTHLLTRTQDEWHDALIRLLASPQLRKRMGEAGRQHALEHYTVPAQAEKLAGALHEAVRSKK